LTAHSAAVDPIRLRAATAADQAAIRAIVRSAGIYPLGLGWRRFTVAEERGRVVGVVQVRAHRDGSRELASLAIVPERRHAAIGTHLVAALLEREPPPLYLTCRDALETFYRRFGFRVIDEPSMPPALRRSQQLGNRLLRLLSRRERVRVMVWEGASVTD
jgi:N-acetylglutamate synthase-like GNAT family acetyltransferase